MAPLDELEAAYRAAAADRGFQARLEDLLASYVGRPTPLTRRGAVGAPRRGAHLAQARGPLPHRRAQDQQRSRPGLLAHAMGKTRVIAETGAGQHGVAVATAAALLGFECRVYMGVEDMRRQELNVVRMRLMGTEVVPVDAGSRTLKDAINEALRDWVTTSAPPTTSSARFSARTPTR
jgi:tryptophan synthase beta chain